MAAGAQVLGTAVVQLQADTAQFRAQTAQASANLRQVDAQARAASTGMSTFTKAALAAGAGMAVFAGARGLQAGIRGLIEFDSAMQQSISIMSDVSDLMRGRMTQAARDVGEAMNFAATEGAEAFFFLASAGLDAEQSLASLSAVAEFARAGMFDFATATDLATDAQSALGLTVKDAQANLMNMTRVTDVLVKANTLANATVEQFSTALTSEAGAALKTFGKDVEEGVAVLAAFADQGIKAEKAGSGLSRIFRLMASAAVNNGDAMKELGIEFFDAQGNMRNMADVIENLEDVLGGMSDQQRTAALEAVGFAARVQGILQPLLGTSDAIRRYEAELRKAGGTTADVAERQMQSLENRIGSVRRAFENWRTGALERIVPAIEFVIDNAAVLADVLTLVALVAGGALVKSLVAAATALTSKVAAAVAEAAATRAALQAQVQKTAAELAAARAVEGYTVASARATVTEGARQAQIARTSQLLAAHATATTAAAGATTRWGAAMGTLGRAIGPGGFLVLGLLAAVGAFAGLRRAMRESSEEAEAFQRSVEDAGDALQGLNRDAARATLSQLSAALATAKVRAEESALEFERFQRQLRQAGRFEQDDFGLQEALATSEFKQGMDEAGESVKALEALVKSARDRVLDLGTADLDQLVNEFQRAEAEVKRLEDVVETARARVSTLQLEAVDDSGTFDFGRLREAQSTLDAMEQALDQAKDRAASLQMAMERLGEASGDGGAASQVSELVTALRQAVADEQKLLDATLAGEDALREANREIERQTDLRDALAQAQAGEEGTVKALVNALHDLKAAREGAAAAAQEQAEAEEAAARARERALEGFGEARSELLLQIRNTHQLARAARDGADALREEEIAQASAAAARSLGAAATAEEREEIEELVEAVMRLQDAFEEEQRERQNAAAEARRFAEPWLQAARNIQDAFSGAFRDLLSGELDSFRDFADRVLDIFIDLAAQIASVMVADALGIPDLLKDLQDGGVDAIKGIQEAAAEAVQAAAGPIAGVGVGVSTGDPFAGAAAGAATGALTFGVPGAILGGLGGLFGGILGGDDDSEAERELIRAQREAARIMEQNNQRLEELRQALSDNPGVTAAAASDAFATTKEFESLFAGFGPLLGGLGGPFQNPFEEFDLSVDDVLDGIDMEEFERVFEGLGGSFDDLMAIADEQDIRLFDEAGNLIPGALDDIGEAAQLFAEQVQKAQDAFADTVEVRRLSALGRDEEADALRLQIRHEQELAEARASGFDAATLAALEHVHALEEEVQAQEAAARAAEEAARVARQAADFFAQMAAEEAIFQGDDAAANRILGEAQVEARLHSFRDLMEDGIISEADFARISRFVWANFETAMEEQAAEAARRIAQQVTDFQTLLASESAELAGDDIEVQRIVGEAQIARTLSAFEELVEAGEISAEEFRELARVLGDNLTKALEEAERAAREAAEAERFRARVDMDNLRVQLLQLRGMDREALALRQQIELMQALQEERGAEYIAILRQIHAIQAQNLAQDLARKAQEDAARAAEDTARAMGQVTQALNAPAGLRLSLLQWRAAVVDTPVGPSFEEATGFANTLGGTGGALMPAPQEVVDVTASVDQAPPTVVEVEGLSGFTAATVAFQDAVADFAAVESQAPAVEVEAVTNVTATAGAQAVPSVEVGEAPSLTAAAASFLESTEGFAVVATSFQASAANFSAAVASFRETVDSASATGAPEGPSAPVTSVEETAGFAFAAEGRPAPAPSTVQNYYIRNRFGDAVIRVSERDTEEEVLRKWRKALEGTTRRGGVNPATIGPTVV